LSLLHLVRRKAASSGSELCLHLLHLLGLLLLLGWRRAGNQSQRVEGHLEQRLVLINVDGEKLLAVDLRRGDNAPLLARQVPRSARDQVRSTLPLQQPTGTQAVSTKAIPNRRR